MYAVMKLERIARRGGASPVVRILLESGVYSFEISEDIERKIIKLVAGGPQPNMEVPVDILQSAKK